MTKTITQMMTTIIRSCITEPQNVYGLTESWLEDSNQCSQLPGFGTASSGRWAGGGGGGIEEYDRRRLTMRLCVPGKAFISDHTPRLPVWLPGSSHTTRCDVCSVHNCTTLHMQHGSTGARGGTYLDVTCAVVLCRETQLAKPYNAKYDWCVL